MALLCAGQVWAVPTFNRQTGQSCMACHAGGQFPELTPYGRSFKMTGYTIGERAMPVSAMVLASVSKVANTSRSDDPGADFQKNGSLILPTASIFLAGKVMDNLGAFVQVTYDQYASQDAGGHFHGHASADNMDLRWADHYVDDRQDLIVGLSLNNNPSVTDPWNTAGAWMQYVPVPSPSSSQFIDGNAPYPGLSAGGGIAGLSAYGFWDRTVYAELGAYRSAQGLLHFLRAGSAAADTTRLQGLNPYWRLALSHEWGAHNLMLGSSGMLSRIYDDPLDTSSSATTHHIRDFGVDAQYQYLLDPNAITAQFAMVRSHHRYPADQAGQTVAFVGPTGQPLALTNAVDTSTIARAKLTWVWQARYGSSLGLFNLHGSRNTANQSSGYDPASLTITSDAAAAAPSLRVNGNLSGDPDTRGWTGEVFWTPIQFMRIGLQYTAYGRYNGAARNYDGLGRDARDNNSMFLYLWAAY